MPVPIGMIGSQSDEQPLSGLLDISFLATEMPKEASSGFVTLADKDADDLMSIWLHAEKLDKDTYSINDEVGLDNKDVIRLKARGLLCGGSEKVTFTSRARTVIKTMTLGENNKFLEKRVEKPYSEILASMDKRGKAGFRVAEDGSSVAEEKSTGIYDENSHLLNLS